MRRCVSRIRKVSRNLCRRVGANSSNCGFRPYGVQEGADLPHRSQVMDALVGPGLGDELPILGRQVPMTRPKHAIAVDRAAKHRAALGPTFRRHEETLEEALRYPDKVDGQRQVDVDQCICCRETVPGELTQPKPINDPCVTPQSSAWSSDTGRARPCSPARNWIWSKGYKADA